MCALVRIAKYVQTAHYVQSAQYVQTVQGVHTAPFHSHLLKYASIPKYARHIKSDTITHTPSSKTHLCSQLTSETTHHYVRTRPHTGWRSFVLVSGKSESTFTYKAGLLGIQWYMKHRFHIDVTFCIGVCDPMRAFPKAIMEINPSAVVAKDYIHVRTLHLPLNLQLNSI
jgi:hypothetical protein